MARTLLFTRARGSFVKSCHDHLHRKDVLQKGCSLLAALFCAFVVCAGASSTAFAENASQGLKPSPVYSPAWASKKMRAQTPNGSYLSSVSVQKQETLNDFLF